MARWDGQERRHVRRDQDSREPRHDSTFSFSGWFGSASYSGNRLMELVLLVMAMGIMLILTMVWLHRGDMKEARQEHTAALLEVARTQRFFGCIISIPMEQRPLEMSKGSYCAELSHYEVPRR